MEEMGDANFFKLKSISDQIAFNKSEVANMQEQVKKMTKVYARNEERKKEFTDVEDEQDR